VSERREHPVLWGLVALVTVAALLGLVVGIGALAASRMVGIGGSGDAASAGGGETLRIPEPSDTSTPSAEPSDDGTKPPKKPRKSRAAQTAITLTAGQTAVAPMQEIDLTGSYPGGDGAILQVQRFDGSNWLDFPVTASVSGGTFSTYIQTGQAGANRFRVADKASGEVSNRVTVTIG
jgi:hypothetical protein